MALEVGDNLTVYDIDEEEGTIELSDDKGVIHTFDLDLGDSAPELLAAALPEMPRDLVCPQCGNDRLLYVEDIGCTRQVEGFNADGTLRVNGLYSTAGWDEGENPRIACSSCLREFSAVREPIDFT